MKNKGFTLVEVIAVLALIAVLVIIFVPIISNGFYRSKKLLKDYDKQALIDGAKTYLTNLKEDGYNIKTVNTYDSSCNITNTTSNYEKESYTAPDGTIYSGYEYIKYAAGNDLYITAKYLVDNGYFNNGCKYDATENSCEKSAECKVDKECTLVVHYNAEKTKANPKCDLGDKCTFYYELGDYTINIQDESKCIIK